MKISGIFDNSLNKHNKYLDDIKIIKPKLDNLKKGTKIIITTLNAEQILNQTNGIREKIDLYLFDRNYNFKHIKKKLIYDHKKTN